MISTRCRLVVLLTVLLNADVLGAVDPLVSPAVFLNTPSNRTLLRESSNADVDIGAPFPAWSFEPGKPIIPAPDDPALWPEFRRRLTAWRDSARREQGYSGALYDRADMSWAASNFSCCFLMLCDETFYDPKAGRYTVKAFLAREAIHFGGYDSVVLWHAYPRIGLDDRNQFDFYRDMPGGLPGLRAVVDELHSAGVRVFINYNPWDTGTRREGRADLEVLADLARELDADGIFLDTMDRGAPEFRRLLDAVRPGVVLESEIALPVDRIHDHHLSWAQWFGDSGVPGVLRNKWFEPRHLQHQIRRWDLDHSGELQTAWINGSGMMVWENVFGSHIGWNERDKSILRSMLPIQRRFARLFTHGRWTPLVPTLSPSIYASLWEAGGLRLWTLVNRSEGAFEGVALEVERKTGEQVYDVIHGVEADRERMELNIPARGVACVVAARRGKLGDDWDRFLKQQQSMTQRARGDVEKRTPATHLTLVNRTRLYAEPPAGMVVIPAANTTVTTFLRVRECGYYESVPRPGQQLGASYDFHLSPAFERQVNVSRFAIDVAPVTNADYAEFLKASSYQPRQLKNFLKHWGRLTPPVGLEDHPVVYVDLDDARAYAEWAGKRLPTEEEWQYAAQGGDGRRYPWGDEMEPERCNGGESGGTTPVRAFPAGRSPFGLYDMCGNTWEWTESERSDGRTRFSMLRGGSFYEAKGSGWYMNGGPRPVDFAQKFLHMWPGLDRCATIGFRCVADMRPQ